MIDLTKLYKKVDHYGTEELRLLVTDEELLQLPKEIIGRLMSFGFRGNEFRRLSQAYTIKRMMEHKVKV